MRWISWMQAPDASRSSLTMAASQQAPSTPASARVGDPSASAAFASPLQIPEGGMTHSQASRRVLAGACHPQCKKLW